MDSKQNHTTKGWEVVMEILFGYAFMSIYLKEAFTKSD